jgi:small GTP-binding protein
MTDIKLISTPKIIVVGSSVAGKTNLFQLLTNRCFNATSKPTIGVAFAHMTFTVDGEDVQFNIWDVAGKERYQPTGKPYFNNAVGVILVFDLTNRESFDEVPKWLEDAQPLCPPNVSILLLGNKSDDAEHRTVTAMEAEEFSQRHHLTYRV